MIRFSNIAYVALVLSILLISSAPIASAEPVTYRAELNPFPEPLTLKQRIPVEGGPIGVDLEATVNACTITAEVSGDIHLDPRTGIISVHGTNGKLSSNGDVVLKGNAFIDFGVPLSEAFFGENQNYHIKQEIELPELNINKNWNESDTFSTYGILHPLLLGYNESFTLYITRIELATGLNADEIVPVVASTVLNGETLTGAVKIFIDNLSDYLDARVGLYATLSMQPTLSGKSVNVKGTLVKYARGSLNFAEAQEIKAEGVNIDKEAKEIKVEGVPILGPNFRRHFSEEFLESQIYHSGKQIAYKIESSYDAEFTDTLELNAHVYSHANVSICGGIEIWSYTRPPGTVTRLSLLSEETFDLDFSDAEPVLGPISYISSRWEEENSDRKRAKGVIPDPVLARKVRETLGIVPERPPLSTDPDDPKERPLSADDMLRLKTLEKYGGIGSLSGLEYAVNLTELDLRYNGISDVSPLSKLTNLRTLKLVNNPISELSLSGLTNLTNLTFESTKPSKVSLSDMPNLTKLYVNPFWELSLSNLPKLEVSGFGGLERLTDGFKLSVSDMPQLKTLGLSHTNISEVSLSDMPNLTKLGLNQTNLSALSLSDMPNLTELSFHRNNNISEVSLSDMPNLTELWFDDANISALSLPTNMPNLAELYIRHSNLPALSLPDMPNLTTLTLDAANISGNDTHLSALLLPDMPKLTKLTLDAANISTVSLPTNMPKLTWLYLVANSISALSLPNMPELTELTLHTPNISALSLPYMPQLTKLVLRAKSISDISALSGLTQLTELNLNLLDNNALALSLSGLTQLTTLNVWGNGISEVSLSDMPQLTELKLPTNRSISAVSLSDIPQLTELKLSDTNLSALSLSDMPNLTTLYLSSTHISDISFLLELPNLQELHLRNTPLNYVSRNTYIPALRKKEVSVEFYMPAHLEKMSGTGQVGIVNTELPLPFVVQAFDWQDNPIPNVPIKFVIYQGEGTLSTTTTTTDATGKAETRLTLGTDPGEIKVGVIADSADLKTSVSFIATAKYAEDVNGDGTVNIQDLVQVSANFGETGENPADVNADGVVNIIDLTLVAAALGKTAAAPAAHATIIEHLTATEVKHYLHAAQHANLTDPTFQRGVEVLKHLLTLLTPKETALLPNYPNPFNPETWIPYQLATPAEVALRIYAVDGSLVRVLSLGHKTTGIYQTRARAAYWDGRNAVGEPVASGLYFYTLTAGEFTATRKMLIRK